MSLYFTNDTVVVCIDPPNLPESEIREYKFRFDSRFILLYDDGNLSRIHHIDDLIVRLYWLIFRNQFPELVYD